MGDKNISTLGYISDSRSLAGTDLFPDLANHITASDYLTRAVYPLLDDALNHLLSTIESNGEFERYVDMLQERQVRA